jgi:hypothetical protein
MKPDRCPTCKRRMTRSPEANRRYWALLHVMAEKLKPLDHSYSADSWHTWAKSKWLGCDDVKLPSGKVLVIPRSTADLDTAAFNDYMTAVEVWANEKGAYLEDDPFAA